MGPAFTAFYKSVKTVLALQQMRLWTPAPKGRLAEAFLTWEHPLLHLSLLLPKFPAWPLQIEKRLEGRLEG